MPGEWTLGISTADNGAAPYLRFGHSRTPVQQVALDTAIEVVLRARHRPGRDHVVKAIGGGLHEFRIRRTRGRDRPDVQLRAALGVRTSERVLCARLSTSTANAVVLLRGGYDQGADAAQRQRRQQREIPRPARRVLGAAAPRTPRRATRPPYEGVPHLGGMTETARAGLRSGGRVAVGQ